jgi:hypothetical protein
VPSVVGPRNTLLTNLYGRYTSAGRAPVLQFLFHDRIRASQEALSPQALSRLGTIGRWGRPVGRGLGAAGVVLTVAAAIGSVVPGVGTVVGAAVGAVAGGISGSIAGGHVGEAAKDVFRSGRQAVGNALSVGDAASNAGRAVGDAASSGASGTKNVVGGLVRSTF